MTTLLTPHFPEEQAQKVIEWARNTGLQVAETLVNEVRDWLGHPENITPVVDKWSPQATGHLTTAAEGINDSARKMNEFWKGRAQEGFESYTGHLQTISTSTRGVAKDVADTLNASLTTITDAYQAAIDFIAEAGKAIVGALKSVPDIAEGLIAKNPARLLSGALNAIVTALQSFITAVTNLTKSTIGIITKNTQTGLKLDSAASLLQVPDEASATLGDQSQWKVRPWEE